MDRAARDRLKWKCRRGLLELDLVLERFLQGPAAQLTDEQLERLGELLEQPDNELWDAVCGRSERFDGRYPDLVERLRAC
ncbi:MAG: succinate dehydrogenase assembly factor 2 [Betaproteobacteria bacterium]|nr:succinate dehydrogenase assembly factor 2 [Betaproteobacteria bacterium]